MLIAALGVLVARPAIAVPIDAVEIPAGQLMMGSDDGPEDERPAHIQHVRAFAIDRYPVSNAAFAEFLNAIGPRAANGQRLYDEDDGDARIHLRGGVWTADAGFENHPSVEPSWFGARDYCAWVGGRLPTEPEWERAARGDDGRIYPWGNDPPDPTMARFGGSMNSYVAIGNYPRNVSPFGAVDMAGNVWNWVSSLYRPYPYAPDDGREDPDSTAERVTRGGGHSTSMATLRSAHRGKGLSRSPTAGHHNIGFRCAYDR
jgi:iron(II)-dependent oxidoreductase